MRTDPDALDESQWGIVADRVLDALSSPGEEARLEAIGIAGGLFKYQFGDDPDPLRHHAVRIVEAVSVLIESESKAVACEAAAYTSWHSRLLDDKAPTIRRLIALIERGEIEPVWRGAMALGMMGTGEPSGYAGLDGDVLDAVGAALARGGLTRKEAVYLRACVNHAHSEPEKAISMMDQWSRSKDPTARRAAARGVSAVGMKFSARDRAPDPVLLSRAAVLGVPILIRLLEDWHIGVRSTAASSLSRFGPLASDATDALIDRLDDPDRDVRLMAIWALAQIGGAASAAIPPLIQILNSADPDAREAARDAILRITPGS